MTKAVFTGVRRDLRRRAPLENGVGYTTIPDGHEIADVEIIVDLPALVKRLGPQAMANKSGTSKYLSGLVIVKVLKRETVRP